MKKYHLHAGLLMAIGAALLGGILIGVVVGYDLGWEKSKSKTKDVSIASFEQCAAAGYPIMESYPRQCRANGQTFVEDINRPIPVEPDGGIGDTPIGGCKPAGCSGQICAEANEAANIVTDCMYRQEYACYQLTKCERQTTGQCGWTKTTAFSACLANPPSLQ